MALISKYDSSNWFKEPVVKPTLMEFNKAAKGWKPKTTHPKNYLTPTLAKMYLNVFKLDSTFSSGGCVYFLGLDDDGYYTQIV